MAIGQHLVLRSAEVSNSCSKDSLFATHEDSHENESDGHDQQGAFALFLLVCSTGGDDLRLQSDCRTFAAFATGTRLYEKLWSRPRQLLEHVFAQPAVWRLRRGGRILFGLVCRPQSLHQVKPIFNSAIL